MNTKQNSCSSLHHDVTVIGSGWTGLVSVKYMLEEGLSVVALEKRDTIGGVWCYSDDPKIPSVMKSTRCTSSSTITEMSDYPMPLEIGMFPHHTDVIKYLHSYAEKFNLLPRVRLNTCVEKVEKDGDLWRVTCSTGDIFTSTYLVIATGTLQQPNLELEGTMLQGYTGKIIHASQIKKPTEEHKGKRVLMVGGGETGSDICMDLFDHVKFIYWSIPRGQHFFRKYAKVVPWGKPQALDKASSRMLKKIAPFHKSKPGLAWVCKLTTNGSLLAYQGHGIPEWKNNADFFKFFINKNGKVLDLVDYERLVPKGGITECNGREITFVDGTKEEFDLVIMSTGYKYQFPFLPERYSKVKIKEKHKFVFDVEDPSIAFIGLVRPVVGSIVGISELQVRWAARVFSNKVPLKMIEERRKDVSQDTAHWNEYFKESSQRIEGLVEGFTYVDDMGRQAQITPDYWSLFKRNPYHWYVAFFAPYNAATFRLNEPEHVDQAIETMQSHRQVTLNPIHLLLIVFLRFIWFDWLLNKISSLKYRIQIASWWPTVRSWRISSAFHSLWMRATAWFFDQESDDKDTISIQAKEYMAESAETEHSVSKTTGCSDELIDCAVGNGHVTIAGSNGLHHRHHDIEVYSHE